MQTVAFATAMGNYLVQFKFVSFNRDTTAALEDAIAQLSFFDPSESKSRAGAESSPYRPGVALFPANRMGRLHDGSVSGNIYTNDDLKLRYEFPHNWVLMSKAHGKRNLNEKPDLFWGNSPRIQSEREADGPCTKRLLFVRRFVDNPASGQFNPMLLLIAADPRCISMSAFPNSIDDRDKVQQIALDSIAYFKTPELTPAAPARFRALNMGSQLMIDVSQSFRLTPPAQNAPTNILFSALIMKSADYWVLWIFAAADKSDMEELRNTRIFFDDSPSAPLKTMP
jgi:hypothetical protein